MMYDVTGINLIEFVKGVYDMSSPMGMGYLHFTATLMTDEQAREQIIDEGCYAVNMDYVGGRCCKMWVRRKDGKLYVRGYWPDHSTNQLRELFLRCNFEPKELTDEEVYGKQDD
jgi:hypothetical protein